MVLWGVEYASPQIYSKWLKSTDHSKNIFISDLDPYFFANGNALVACDQNN
jgi:hypothetical protein